MIQLLFLSLAAACWAVMAHLQFHNRNNGLFSKYSFFGTESWKRKYERSLFVGSSGYGLVAAPDTPYYSIFKIKYKEAFPWSATALVLFTDGFHLFQWLFIKFILLGFTVTYNRGLQFDWVLFLLLWAAWLLVFNVVYTFLKK